MHVEKTDEYSGTYVGTVKEIENGGALLEIAKMHSRNEDYYRGQLDKCAEYIGEDAYLCDDGTISDSPLRAKIPDCVKKLKEQNDTLVEWVVKSSNDYNELQEKIYPNHSEIKPNPVDEKIIRAILNAEQRRIIY